MPSRASKRRTPPPQSRKAAPGGQPGPQREKNPAAVALSKLGASKGGHARAASLSQAQRSRIARKAAKARWSKR